MKNNKRSVEKVRKLGRKREREGRRGRVGDGEREMRRGKSRR